MDNIDLATKDQTRQRDSTEKHQGISKAGKKAVQEAGQGVQIYLLCRPWQKGSNPSAHGNEQDRQRDNCHHMAEHRKRG